MPHAAPAQFVPLKDHVTPAGAELAKIRVEPPVPKEIPPSSIVTNAVACNWVSPQPLANSSAADDAMIAHVRRFRLIPLNIFSLNIFISALPLNIFAANEMALPKKFNGKLDFTWIGSLRVIAKMRIAEVNILTVEVGMVYQVERFSTHAGDVSTFDWEGLEEGYIVNESRRAADGADRRITEGSVEDVLSVHWRG